MAIKEEKDYTLKDVTGKIVNFGDKVAVLCKSYGRRGLASAELVVCYYEGHGQYGHIFGYAGRNGDRYTFNKREPELVVISPAEDDEK